MNDRTHWALWSLRISTIIYYLIFIACVVGAMLLPDNDDFPPLLLIIMAVFTLPFVVFLEFVIAHLKQNRFWAWVAGVAVGGLYAPSLFLPLGVFILVGLLSDGSRARFLDQK